MDSAKKAIKQIREKQYWEPFINKGKELFLLGTGGFRNRQIEVIAERL